MFGRKSESGRKSPGRFMSGINDEVHGAHFEGDDIVLSKELGGGRFPSRPLGERMPDTPDGEFRLVLQELRIRTGGDAVGDPAVSVDTVPRELVLSFLGRPGLSGMLSAWTPREEDARDAVLEATLFQPIPYDYSTGIMSREFRNYRGMPPMSEGDGLPGPVCMYGDEVGFDSDDERSVWTLDQGFGYHLRDRTVVLSRDLDSLELDMVDLVSSEGFEDGRFYPAIDSNLLTKVLIEAGAEPPEETGPPGVSRTPITTNLARRICQSYAHVGGLCVYTPRREDAWSLVSGLHDRAKPFEKDVPRGAEGSVAGCIGLRGKDTVCVMYGRR